MIKKSKKKPTIWIFNTKFKIPHLKGSGLFKRVRKNAYKTFWIDIKKYVNKI